MYDQLWCKMLRLERQGTKLVPPGCLDLEPTSLPQSDEFRQYIANSWRSFSLKSGTTSS